MKYFRPFFPGAELAMLRKLQHHDTQRLEPKVRRRARVKLPPISMPRNGVFKTKFVKVE
jgi:hypothetical protein